MTNIVLPFSPLHSADVSYLVTGAIINVSEQRLCSYVYIYSCGVIMLNAEIELQTVLECSQGLCLISRHCNRKMWNVPEFMQRTPSVKKMKVLIGYAWHLDLMLWPPKSRLLSPWREWVIQSSYQYLLLWIIYSFFHHNVWSQSIVFILMKLCGEKF